MNGAATAESWMSDFDATTPEMRRRMAKRRVVLVLDFDEDGRLVGIDIDHASKNAALDSLQVEDLPLRNVAG